MSGTGRKIIDLSDKNDKITVMSIDIGDDAAMNLYCIFPHLQFTIYINSCKSPFHITIYSGIIPNQKIIMKNQKNLKKTLAIPVKRC
jgi:hypothetical protein